MSNWHRLNSRYRRCPDHVGNVDVVFGQVARIHIKDDVITDTGKIDIPKIKPIARMGYYDYTVIDSVFEMKIPGNTHAPAGLEGKPLPKSD